jgi:hypothetical protein
MERDPGSGRVIFSLFANSQAQGTPGLLGPWVASTTAEPSGISFTEGDSSTVEPGLPGGTIWCNDLPQDAGLIELSFEKAEYSLAAIQTALEAAEGQVKTMTHGSPLFEGERPVLEQRQTQFEMERDTLGLLAFSIEKEATPGVSFSTGSGWDAVSFGPLEDISRKWDQASRQFQEFIERLGQAIGNFAWVETRIGGQLMARTSVDWNGDMDTTWQIQPNPEQVHQHERTLQLALASRITLLRTFAAVTTNAAKLSMLVAAPGGAILALPASLSLINQIINEQVRYQQQIKEIQNGN